MSTTVYTQDTVEKHQIVTSAPSRGGKRIIGTIEKPNPKNVIVIERGTNKRFNVPYTMIEKVEPAGTNAQMPATAPVLMAPWAGEGDIVTVRNGERYRVTQVNRSRYHVIRLRDGGLFALSKQAVVSVENGKDARLAWLKAHGISEADAQAFDKAFVATM
jgi:hypothetical protein